MRRIIREIEPPQAEHASDTTPIADSRTACRGAPRKPQLRQLAASLRGDLDWITMKALEKDRTRRYQTANALALDVRRHLDQRTGLGRAPERGVSDAASSSGGTGSALRPA